MEGGSVEWRKRKKSEEGGKEVKIMGRGRKREVRKLGERRGKESQMRREVEGGN